MSNDSVVVSLPFLEEGKQVDPARLRQTLIDLFSENELRDLCFDLSVDFESLPALGKADKARELITYFRRRQRLNVLLDAVHRERPNVVWSTLLVEVTESQPEALALSSPLGLPAADKTNTFIVGKSLTALVRLMRSAEVRTAVVAFQTDFQAASTQIDLMNDYKYLHDLFQELENRYFLIYNDQKRLPADEMAWNSIMLHEPELLAKMSDLIDAVNRAPFAAEEAHWVQQLNKAREDIHHAVEEFDEESLKSGTRQLYRVINRQPSRINAQLVTTAGALRLDALERAMTTIGNSLDPAEFELEAVHLIKDGVHALAGLDQRVKSLVREHNAWQAIDDELRRVEGSLNQGIEELEDAWLDLEPMARDLFGNRNDDWAVELQQAEAALTKALTEAVVVRVMSLFRRFRSQIGRRFRRVDFELLALCQELQKVGASLDVLLRNFR